MIDFMDTLTPEELAEFEHQCFLNETFRGKRANMERLLRYNVLRKLAVELFHSWEDVVKVAEYAPSPEHRHAQLWIETYHITSAFKPEMDLLVQLMQKADHFGTCTIDLKNGEQGIRFLFMVMNVWE